jgi:DNA-binding phage protein
VPTSDSYNDYLLASLKDSEEAAAYLEAILEENHPEPELLSRALKNVATSLGKQQMSSEQLSQHVEKLDDLLQQEGSDAVFGLAEWLDVLGLKLAVIPQESRQEE